MGFFRMRPQTNDTISLLYIYENNFILHVNDVYQFLFYLKQCKSIKIHCKRQCNRLEHGQGARQANVINIFQLC